MLSIMSLVESLGIFERNRVPIPVRPILFGVSRAPFWARGLMFGGLVCLLGLVVFAAGSPSEL